MKEKADGAVSIDSVKMLTWRLNIKGYGAREVQGSAGARLNTSVWCRDGNFEFVFEPREYDGKVIEAELVDIKKRQ